VSDPSELRQLFALGRDLPLWPVARLGDVVEITKKPRDLARSAEYPFIPMELISERGTKPDGWEKRSGVKGGAYWESGDVLLARITPCFENGKLAVAPEVPGGRGFATTEVYPLRSEVLLPEFLAYYLRARPVRESLIASMEGATGRMRVPRHALEALPVPIPQKDEQLAITDAIEALLDEVRDGRRSVETARARLVEFEAAALAALLSGSFLTLSRRSRNALKSAKRIRLGDIATIQYGWTAKARHDPIGPRMLRITDIQNGNVDWADVPYCEIPDARLPKYLLSTGDLVFARSGATTGKSYLIGDDVPTAVFASYLIRVRPAETLRSEFLALFFQSSEYWGFVARRRRGMAQPNLNGSLLGKLEVPVPDLQTQDAVLQVARTHLRSVRDVSATLDQALDQAGPLEEGVLHAAFSGRLISHQAKATPVPAGDAS
jgi:type I restriction enzyme, S subunit